MPKVPNYKLVVALLIFVVILILAVPFVRAEAPAKQDQHYRDLAKQHFDLAVSQFEQKDLFAACSNLRISKSYARHTDDIIVNEHLDLLLIKMCGSNR